MKTWLKIEDCDNRGALEDGSYLSVLRPPRGNPGKPITVRVIEYTLSHPSRTQGEAPIRLITTLLDPAQAPALELAALYGERWEEESAFDELKTHQRGAGRVLRSKSPEMVTQEIYAHLLVYYAIRALINAAVEPQELDPDRVSFLASLGFFAARSPTRRPFPPDRLTRAIAETTIEILTRLNKRRLRANPRVIKRKMSKWPLKRAHQLNPARPQAHPRDTIVITGPSRTSPKKRHTNGASGLGP